MWTRPQTLALLLPAVVLLTALIGCSSNPTAPPSSANAKKSEAPQSSAAAAPKTISACEWTDAAIVAANITSITAGSYDFRKSVGATDTDKPEGQAGSCEVDPFIEGGASSAALFVDVVTGSGMDTLLRTAKTNSTTTTYKGITIYTLTYGGAAIAQLDSSHVLQVQMMHGDLGSDTALTLDGIIANALIDEWNAGVHPES